MKLLQGKIKPRQACVGEGLGEIFLPGKSQGQRSLVGYCPRGRKELDTTEQLNNYYLEKASKFREVEFKVARSSHGNSLSGDEEARTRPQDGKGSEREPVKRSVAEALSKSVAGGLREFGRSERSYRPWERSRFLLLASNVWRWPWGRGKMVTLRGPWSALPCHIPNAIHCWLWSPWTQLW